MAFAGVEPITASTRHRLEGAIEASVASLCCAMLSEHRKMAECPAGLSEFVFQPVAGSRMAVNRSSVDAAASSLLPEWMRRKSMSTGLGGYGVISEIRVP